MTFYSCKLLHTACNGMYMIITTDSCDFSGLWSKVPGAGRLLSGQSGLEALTKTHLLEIKPCFAAKAEKSKLAGTMRGDQGLLRECRWNCDVIYYGLLGSCETLWNLFLSFLPEHQVWLRRQVPICWVISMLHLGCNVGAQAMTFRNFEIASQVMHWIIHRSGLRIF